MINLGTNHIDYNSNLFVDFVNQNGNLDTLKALFLKMDVTLQYIHECGYCIDGFSPTDILILINPNNSTFEVIFKKLMKLPIDDSTRSKLIKTDILKSAILQIDTYVYCAGLKTDYLTFLKRFNLNSISENFLKIEKILPKELVPYYRGIIKENIINYLNKYLIKKEEYDSERDSVQSSTDTSSKRLVLSSSNVVGIEPISNTVDEWNYRKINGLQEKAFIQILLLPSIILGIILLFGFVLWIVSKYSI